ncbi:MAG TPA: cation:proton antiporter regulatory subunit [Candidatus Wujingus californicus]|uniref:cation:proton antiporter regulatory subunit n=1 Tax=Candidatus Wujingus californicus TaxID=3367618 RepID=UPI001D9C7BD0|nr:cation:proton antiporter regulatory subunit [Planctomycetota bacterium]MDO8131480.1 TrkA C-terminal domain-containing protein [Candidatus Brocadiales bacterium]
MSEIKESDLPGIGKKFTLELDSGDKLVVVIHSSGEREVFKFIHDNDEPTSVTKLNDEEARQIGAILAGTYFQPVIEDEQKLAMKNITMEWIKIVPDSMLANKKIEELNIRKLTGVSITTIIRGEHVIPNPSSHEIIKPQDTIIIVGSNERIKKFIAKFEIKQRLEE